MQSPCIHRFMVYFRNSSGSLAIFAAIRREVSRQVLTMIS
jgi:hypothetical protein